MIAVWGRYTKGQIVEIASLKKKKKGGSFVAANDQVDWKPMTHDFSSFNADRVNLVDSEEVGDRVRAYLEQLGLPLSSNNKVSISKFI